MLLIRNSPLFVRDKLQKQHSMILLVLISASSCIVFYYFTVAVRNLQDASHHLMRNCICPFLRYKDSSVGERDLSPRQWVEARSHCLNFAAIVLTAEDCL